MSIETILTDKAPRPIGPYSQGIALEASAFKGYVFTSGQIGIDPATGALVAGGIETETRRVFENLSAVLVAGGSSLSRAVKVTVYLIDLADFEKMNKIYQEYFGTAAPARTTVAVAGLPKGARVEIDVIAFK